MNEDTTADALLLQKENERLRKELEMYRQLQQVCTVAKTSFWLWPADLSIVEDRLFSNMRMMECCYEWSKGLSVAA